MQWHRTTLPTLYISCCGSDTSLAPPYGGEKGCEAACMERQVSAQRVRINMSQTAREFTGNRESINPKLPYQAYFLSGNEVNKKNAPKREAGKTYNVPFLEEFNDDSDLSAWNVIDANNECQK